MRDDLRALAWFGSLLLVLRAGPEDLPYSPKLTWLAIALMASIYPAWTFGITEPPSDAVMASGGWMLLWSLGAVGSLLAGCFAALRLFGHASRFTQFALALSLVHGLAMLVMFGSVLLRAHFLQPQSVEGVWDAAGAWLAALLPLAATLWYGLAMSHVWARTLDRGYALGLSMTLFMNVAMWLVPVLVLMAYTTLSNFLG